ncbi:MAG: TlyA family RNA methyltransferase [Candidatus Schekmanbacteria bacterium]|nr:TlyA family RNA methyltransferase [Candidatus Schekmanbacteria bacterium]
MSKQRLDKILFDKGLAQSRQQAQALVIAGSVLVNGEVCDKPGANFKLDVEISLKDTPSPYVSRGGIKLAGALDKLSLDLEGKITLDVGASTGGFTDYLLQKGVKKVYALDVGYGQLAWKLRRDARVVVYERTNIRYFKPEQLPERVDLAVIDVSFISLTLVIPAVLPFLKPDGHIIALIKPQFEVGKGEVGKGGVVKDAEQQKAVVEKISKFGNGFNLKELAVIPSPIPGPKGNQEYFIVWQI